MSDAIEDRAREIHKSISSRTCADDGNCRDDMARCYCLDEIKEISAALRAEGSVIKQAITDPENQPSQYGTVTLEFHEAALRAEGNRALEEAAELAAAKYKKELIQCNYDAGYSACARAIEAAILALRT